MNRRLQARLLINEAGLYCEDLEYSPIDGRQYELLSIVETLLLVWCDRISGDSLSSDVFNWLMRVYESYL